MMDIVIGYINYNGKLLLNTEYSEIYRVDQTDSKKDIYLIARKDGKYGVIKNKDIVIDFDNQDIIYDNKTQLLKLEKNSKFGAYEISGKQILERRYSELNFEGIYIHAKLNGEDLYFDRRGNQVDNFKYALVNDTRNNNYFITVNQSGLYGVINKDKKVLIENKYNYLEYTYDNYFIAYNNENKLGVIDEKGNEIVGFKYDVLSKLENSNILQGKILNQNVVDLYSNQMEKIDTSERLIVVENEKYVQVYNGKISKYFDKDGNKLSSKEVLADQSLYSKEENGMYGFCDKNGIIKVEFTYEGVTEFNKYGFAGIKQDGKWGIINENAEIIKEPIYVINNTDTIPDFIGEYYKVEYENGQVYFTDTLVE